MTENNIFQEIADDLEHQRLEALWMRHGPKIVALLLMLILAVGVYTAWQSWEDKRNQKATANLVDLMNPKDTDVIKQIEALKGFSDKNGHLIQATLAQLHAASLAAQNGKVDQAIQIYNAVAADSKTDEAFRQFAILLSVQLQLNTGDASILSQRLDPLVANNAPWRFTAMEYQGYLALRADNKGKARDIFMQLSQNAQVPPTLSARASDILHSIAE